MAASSDRLSKSARTRRRILDAAAVEFQRHGYTDARLVDIAERAGMQVGSLYHHFASGDELVTEVLHLGIDAVSQHVRQAIDATARESSPIERIATAVRAHTLAVLEVSDYGSAQAKLSSQVGAEIAKTYRAKQRAYGAYWHELLAAAQRAGEIAAAADLVTVRLLAFGAMNWTCEWFKPSRGRTANAVADHAVAMILHGIALQRQGLGGCTKTWPFARVGGKRSSPSKTTE